MGVGCYATGGETADVGDLVRTIIVDSTVTCRMKRADVIDNANIRPGDVIVGLASFGQATYEKEYNGGMGSNGLTSARHDVFCQIPGRKIPGKLRQGCPRRTGLQRWLEADRPPDHGSRLNRPKLEDWKELVPESEAVLSNAEVIGGKLFLTYDKDASNHAYVYGLDGKQIQEIQLPSLGSVGFSGNKDDKECFFGFTSFTIPGATYKYDMDQNTYELYRAPKVQFNSDDFVTEQVFFASKDGVKVPMFLTYKKDLKKDGKNPVFLYGYGGFGISLNPGSVQCASHSSKMAVSTHSQPAWWQRIR